MYIMTCIFDIPNKEMTAVTFCLSLISFILHACHAMPILVYTKLIERRWNECVNYALSRYREHAACLCKACMACRFCIVVPHQAHFGQERW